MSFFADLIGLQWLRSVKASRGIMILAAIYAIFLLCETFVGMIILILVCIFMLFLFLIVPRMVAKEEAKSTWDDDPGVKRRIAAREAFEKEQELKKENNPYA